jgi:hypothetical protein
MSYERRGEQTEYAEAVVRKEETWQTKVNIARTLLACRYIRNEGH